MDLFDVVNQDIFSLQVLRYLYNFCCVVLCLEGEVVDLDQIILGDCP
jgi:hypothetical protein